MRCTEHRRKEKDKPWRVEIREDRPAGRCEVGKGERKGRGGVEVLAAPFTSVNYAVSMYQ